MKKMNFFHGKKFDRDFVQVLILSQFFRLPICSLFVLSNLLTIIISFFSDFRFKGRPSVAHTDPHEGGQAVQVRPVLQSLRKLQLPLATHKDTSRHQALQVSPGN